MPDSRASSPRAGARRLLPAALILVGAAGIVALQRTDRAAHPGPEQGDAAKAKPQPSDPGHVASASGPAGGTAMPTTAGAPSAAPTSPLAAIIAARTAGTGPAVPVRAAQPLARVNDVVITGDRLLAFRKDDPAEQTMTQEMFAFLLERAVDRELVAQEARARKVDLTAEQRTQLDALGAAAPDDTALDPAQRAFDFDVARAALLESNLLAIAGTRQPSVSDADVQRHYERHEAELGPLPENPAKRAAAWQALELRLRQQLATQAQQQYHAALQTFRTRLRSAARITE